MFVKITLFLLSVLLLVGCKRHNGVDADVIRKTTVFVPDDSLLLLKPKRLKSDNMLNSYPDYRFLIYIDSVYCSSCELQRLGMWHSIIKKVREYDLDVNFLFIFNPRANERFQLIESYYKNPINLDIYIDTAKILEKRNPILKNRIFHTVLLDVNNKIVKFGDPSKDIDAENNLYGYLESLDNDTSPES